ncbi:TraR/DksA C4-type zinc finger protein [Candidatus Falkowbacteria bacterium]|nr:TraR/DksA C4-type zinc finger protein [Candidatus Falkowbacteria bacterium]
MGEKLNKKDLAEIEKKLLQEKASLEKELAEIARKNPYNPDDYQAVFEEYGNDASDSIAEVTKFDLNLSLEQTLEKALRDVNKAVDSLKKGNYGICKYCKQPIDKARLLARPTSSACVSCKNKLKSL